MPTEYPRDDFATHAPNGQSPEARSLALLAHWMDNAIQVPGLGLRFGLDAILGLIPGVGDAGSSLVSMYILAAASRLGVPRIALVRMTLNVLLDVIVGAIPVLGDLFDAYWKCNQRNVDLVRRHLAAAPATARKMRTADWLFVAVLAAIVCLLVAASVVATYFLGAWLYQALFGSDNPQ